MLDRYVAQVRLLLSTLQDIANETVFALKGGTAINLFYRDMPRLSVDIDLTYPWRTANPPSRESTTPSAASWLPLPAATPGSKRAASRVPEMPTRASW